MAVDKRPSDENWRDVRWGTRMAWTSALLRRWWNRHHRRLGDTPAPDDPRHEVQSYRVDPAAALERAATEHWQAAQELERAAAVHRAVMARLQVDIDALDTGQSETRPDVAVRAGVEPNPHVEAPEVTIPGLAACLLGPFDVALHGTAMPPWRSQKAASLLKYLLLHSDRQPTRRDILTDAFWPYSSAASARNNLNVTIYTLRRVLHEVEPDRLHIVYSQGAYFLNPDLERWLDVEAFAAACRLGQGSFEQGDAAGALKSYSDARRLYRGPLLDADTSGEWFLDDQRRLHEEHRTVLERMGQILFERGSLRASAALGEELVQDDPCRESAHQLLMRCYAGLDQPQLMVRQYQRCVELLRRELAVDPHPSTRALFSTLSTR